MGDDDVTLGEVYRTVKAMRDDLAQVRSAAVLRAEYEIRMVAMDREIRDIKANHDKDIDEIKTASTTPPVWPVIVGGITSVAACVLSVIAIAANHIR